jgi:DNA-binding LacI/PurR family transcriptional regulator
VDYLVALGHRRIAHVAGLPEFQHTRRRMRALRDATGRMAAMATVSAPTDFSDTEGAAATRALLSAPRPPTAIIYDSDLMAVAGLGVAGELGVPVPAALSIVAFDDSVLTRIVHPALTSLTRDTVALGGQVAGELLAVIADPTRTRNVKTPTPRLTVRDSTAAPRPE